MAGTNLNSATSGYAPILWIREVEPTPSGTDDVALAISASCTGTPPVTTNTFAHGCTMLQLNTSTGTNAVYQNTGSAASPAWTLFDTGTGFSLPVTATDASTTTTTSFDITTSALTTGNAERITAAALTSGNVYLAVGSGAAMLTGGSLFTGTMGAATVGAGFSATTTGVYADVNGILRITANSATTGTLAVTSGTGLTTGIGNKVLATAATLTTGRYYSANDSALEVFGIGANGHIHTAQTTAPTIVVTTQNGITASAISAGSSDTAGTITTTGTNNAGGNTVLDVTFNKTFTTAPKAVQLQALNSSASKAAATSLFTAIVSAKAATGFTVTIPSDASAGATPSWSYLVIA